MSHQRPRRLAYTVAAAFALFLALTGMASASVPGLQRVSASSLNDSLPGKDRFAGCPTGKKLLGGGARVLPGNGQVALDGITLDSPLAGVHARAFEDANGTSLRWAVESFAICADPLPGLVQVDTTSPENSFDKAIVATCPVGKELIGAGVETNGGNGQVAIDDLIPNLVKNSVSVFGIETPGGLGSNWTITAHAICADPVPGRELRTLEIGPNSDNQGVVLGCPAGKKLLGLGGEMTGAFGQAVLDNMTPNATLTGASISAREVQGGSTNSWKLKGYAICATA
jgi:hypothetical protein